MFDFLDKYENYKTDYGTNFVCYTINGVELQVIYIVNLKLYSLINWDINEDCCYGLRKVNKNKILDYIEPFLNKKRVVKRFMD